MHSRLTPALPVSRPAPTPPRSAVYAQGGFLGLYKGNGANCLRVVPVYALKFSLNDQIKEWVALRRSAEAAGAGSAAVAAGGGGRKYELTVLEKIVAGCCAGVVQITLTYPLDLVRTRLQLVRAQAAGTHTPTPCAATHRRRLTSLHPSPPSGGGGGHLVLGDPPLPHGHGEAGGPRGAVQRARAEHARRGAVRRLADDVLRGAQGERECVREIGTERKCVEPSLCRAPSGREERVLRSACCLRVMHVPGSGAGPGVWLRVPVAAPQ